MILALLLACDGPTAKRSPDTQSSADTASTDTDPTDTTPACPTLTAINAYGTFSPGETLTLTATGDFPEGTLWTVESGTLDAASGTSVHWELPGNIAEYMATTLEFTAATSGPEGCPTSSLTNTVDVDWAQTDRTVVLYNPNASGSEDVARYYAAFRAIDDDHLCGVPSSDPTTLYGDDFVAWGTDVMDCIHAVGPHIDTIVPVWGVPLHAAGRIADIGGNGVATVSADALLAWGREGVEATDAAYHPAYQDGDSTTGIYDPWVPFGQIRENRQQREFYMVARIDGISPEAAMALVDRTAVAEEIAIAGVLAGTVYVDAEYGDTPPATDEFGSYESGDWNMWGTRRIFEADGRYPVVWDGSPEEFGTEPAQLTCPDALYYAGWYTYGHYNDVFTWVPGAIGGHLDSCSACDIRGSWSWSALALQRGITATFGAVSEPYVAGMPEYDQFFRYLLDGASYGEAAYESTVIGRWTMLWVGDPLYRPYPRQ